MSRTKIGKSGVYTESQEPTTYKKHCDSEGEKLRQLLKNLDTLTRQLTDIKNHLETDRNNKTCFKHLLSSVNQVIHILTLHQEDIERRAVNWRKYSFVPFCWGADLLYPDEKSHTELMTMCKPDDECDTLEGSLRDPNFSRLGTLDLFIPKPLDLRRHDIFTNYFDGHDKQIWLEFKELNKGLREGTEKRPIEVDHSVVSVFSNFAVAAFNNACKEMGQPNNLQDFESRECKFLKASQAYHIYMIIEAIEENKCGTYMAEVVCRTCDNASALCKFVRINHKPIGMKATAVSYLSCLESICKTIDDLLEEKINRLRDIILRLGAPQVYAAACEIQYLGRIFFSTKKGLWSRLSEDSHWHLQSFNSKD